MSFILRKHQCGTFECALHHYDVSTIWLQGNLCALKKLGFISGDDKVNWLSKRNVKAEVLSISPTSQRITELWIAHGLYIDSGATLLVETWLHENTINIS